MTGGATDRIFAFRSAASFAGAAGILAGDLDLCFKAGGCFAERYFQIVAQIRTPFLASSPQASSENIAEFEKFAEYVAEVAKRGGIETAEAALHHLASLNELHNGNRATGPKAGKPLTKIGDEVDLEEIGCIAGPRCANVAGVNLHADVVIPSQDKMRLERLCRYAARPPIDKSRLSGLPDGYLGNQQQLVLARFDARTAIGGQ
jgi:hypothetical protein